MRNVLIALLLACVLGATSAQAQNQDYRNSYRRSSLCLILLAHSDKEYADAMTEVFWNFPLPQRYNEHNISSVRVIRVNGKQNQKSIERLLKQYNVANAVVGRWFNRNGHTGYMDMDLIHERGGYGAAYADYDRSKVNVRGEDMLRDEGIELLQSTFVLVCDMDYLDQKNRAQWGALALGVLSLAMDATAQAKQEEARRQYIRGNYASAQRNLNQAQSWSAGAALGYTGAAVVSDIGGFRVKMNAYLYQLDWNPEMTSRMYSNYWCDSSMSTSEASSRKANFENASDFRLNFIGKYTTKSSKTILRSWSNEAEVILDVCHRCVQKGMVELAKKFPIFRPRAPFYFQGSEMYAHIGLKEEVTLGRSYEVLQPYKDKKGRICYKKLSEVKAGQPWNNLNIRFDQYFDVGELGTHFYYKKRKDLDLPGLQLREK